MFIDALLGNRVNHVSVTLASAAKSGGKPRHAVASQLLRVINHTVQQPHGPSIGLEQLTRVQPQPLQ